MNGLAPREGSWHFGKHGAHQRGLEARLAVPAGSLPPSAVIVDVGSADGAVASELLRSRDRLVAIDIDRERLLTGARALRIRTGRTCFVEADAHALPLRDETCDVAILYSILEHVQDVRQVILEVGRVLRHGGIAYVVTPNPLSPFTLLEDPHAHLPLTHVLPRLIAHWYAEKLLRRRVKEVGRHFVLPSWSEIERAFEAAGMGIQLQTNRLKLERPDLVLSPTRRQVAAWLSRVGFPRLAQTGLGSRLFRFYDRWVARSWALIARRPPAPSLLSRRTAVDTKVGPGRDQIPVTRDVTNER